MAKKISTNIFIERARKVHGDRYDYSETKYTLAKNLVSIICREHGPFLQLPYSHLRGSVCPACAGVARKTTAEWIVKANQAHKNKYTYPNANYVNVNSIIEIVCPKHGAFTQKAKVHLDGCGCPKCKGENHREVLLDGAINDCGIGESRGAYDCWYAMLSRCYNHQNIYRCPTYKDVSVCPQWHVFSNFKEWFDDPANGFQENYQLDKDILVKGNRVYGPDTCCFVPNAINSIFTTRPPKNNNLPIGVFSHNSGRYRAAFKKKHLGLFDNVEAAKHAYGIARDNYIKELATKYYERKSITKKVYDALMSYTTNS